MSKTFDTLKKFLSEEIRMSHIYQPVMLKRIFLNNGSASIHDIVPINYRFKVTSNPQSLSPF